MKRLSQEIEDFSSNKNRKRVSSADHIINFLSFMEDIMRIKIHKPKKEDLEKDGVFSWPIWEKEISRFDWQYDETEECYLLEGKVTVETEDGEIFEFEKGDFVSFQKGLACVWDIKKPVKKHYNFK